MLPQVIMKEDKTKHILVRLGEELYGVDYTCISFVGKNADPVSLIVCGKKLNRDTLLCASYYEDSHGCCCSEGAKHKCNCMGRPELCEML